MHSDRSQLLPGHLEIHRQPLHQLPHLHTPQLSSVHPLVNLLLFQSRHHRLMSSLYHLHLAPFPVI